MTPRGVTIIEAAIALVILGIILSFGMSVAGPLVKARDQQMNEQILERAKASLIGFGKVNDRLPYADTNGDGLEDGATVGDAPGATLGVRAADAQARRLRYDVHDSLVTTSLLTKLGSPLVGAGPTVRPDGPTSSPTAALAFVIVSPGKDGVFEAENNDGNREYVTYTTVPAPQGFDDVVIYMNPFDLWTWVKP